MWASFKQTVRSCVRGSYRCTLPHLGLHFDFISHPGITQALNELADIDARLRWLEANFSAVSEIGVRFLYIDRASPPERRSEHATYIRSRLKVSHEDK